MFFTSCIIIAFFCFAFYLIWNQFLKKDTRLSTGLKVLRKKISELQNLSLSVDTQVDRHNSVVNDKIQRMEYLLKKTSQICQRMEHNIKIATALSNKDLSPKDLSKDQGPEGKAEPLNKAELLDKTEPVPSAEERESLILKPNFKDKEEARALERPPSSTEQVRHLKMVREKPARPKQLYFGESPFVKIGFVESPEKDKKHPDPAP